MGNQIKQILKKNFKSVFNSKVSYFLFFIIPLLLFFVFGIFFINDDSYNVDIGLVFSNSIILQQTYQKTIEETGFNVVLSNGKDDCIKKIKRGILDLCVVFPKDISSSSQVVNVQIIVDNSNKELQEIAKNLLLNSLNRKTTQIKTEYINSIVVLANKLKNTQNDKISNINSIITDTNILGEDLSKVISQIDSEEKNNQAIKIKKLAEEQKKIISDYISISIDLEDDLNEISSDLSKDLNSSEVSDLKDKIDDIKKNHVVFKSDYNLLYSSSSDINPNTLLSNSTKLFDFTTITDNLNLVKSRKDSIQKKNYEIKKDEESLEPILNNISSTEINFLVEPIKFEIIDAFDTENSNASKLILPNLVAIISLIISLILSSSIIFNEKVSFAFQRNILSNISTFKFIFSNYLFLLILLFVQMVGIIFLFNIFFMKIWDLSFLYFIIILIPAISVFILIGILFGTIVKNYIQNVIFMFFLIFIFIIFGGEVIPLEKLDIIAIQIIAILNPYILVKGSLNLILIAEATFYDFLILVGIFIIWIFILTILIMLAQSFIMKRAVYHWLNKSVLVKEDYYQVDNKQPLKIKPDGRIKKKFKSIREKIEKKLKI